MIEPAAFRDEVQATAEGQTFAREELDWWADRLGRELPHGMFGENLTTSGLDVDGALVGERWAVGEDVLLEVARQSAGDRDVHVREARDGARRNKGRIVIERQKTRKQAQPRPAASP